MITRYFIYGYYCVIIYFDVTINDIIIFIMHSLLFLVQQ